MAVRGGSMDMVIVLVAPRERKICWKRFDHLINHQAHGLNAIPDGVPSETRVAFSHIGGHLGENVFRCMQLEHAVVFRFEEEEPVHLSLAE